MQSLSKLYLEPNLTKIATYMTISHDLFQLVVEWLLFDFGKEGYVSILKHEFRKDRID